jgi:hypothetical protein
MAEVVANRAFANAWNRWQRQLRDFHIDRVITTAELLGMPVEKVTRADVVFCHSQYGVPPLDDEAPKIGGASDRRITRAYRSL